MVNRTSRREKVKTVIGGYEAEESKITVSPSPRVPVSKSRGENHAPSRPRFPSVSELQEPERWGVCGRAVEAFEGVLRHHRFRPAPLGSASRWQVEQKVAAIRSIA